MTSTPPTVPVSSSNKEADEVELRSQLRSCLQNLSQREPLDHTYKHLLFDGVVTPRRPTLPKDKLYKNIGANLRETATKFTKHPWDRIAQREPLDETAMRAAFTMREHKKHEQEALLSATLAARNPRDYATHKRKLEGMAMTLQRKKPKHKKVTSRQKTSTAGAAAVEEDARRRAEQERLERLEQHRMREAARRRRLEEEEERREDQLRLARMKETPQLKLQRLVKPMFQTLWDMEFNNLQKTNPFRIVIDANNCAAMGAPDYVDIIQTPMNLTYIHNKIQGLKYATLQEFFGDVELMLNNALLYNSDPTNPYHIAAKEMRKVYRKEGKELVAEIQKHAKKK